VQNKPKTYTECLHKFRH